MILYHDKIGYNCSIKREYQPIGAWSNFDPVKIKMKLPKNDYLSIIKSIKSKSPNIRFDFNIKAGVDDKLSLSPGFYKVESNFERGTITSEYQNGEVDVIMKLSIFKYEHMDKLDIRDILLSGLLN